MNVSWSLSSYYSDNAITDCCNLNGWPGSTKNHEFWDEAHQLFSEYEASVHERRQGSYLYLPIGITAGELMEQSEEWQKLQFIPLNPYSRTAHKYTGRSPIKFKEDKWEHSTKIPHIFFHQQRYLKEFAVKSKDNFSFVSSNDKALIPDGEPNHAISTGVRAHNASLAPPYTNG